jgi:hypothetical protein
MKYWNKTLARVGRDLNMCPCRGEPGLEEREGPSACSSSHFRLGRPFQALSIDLGAQWVILTLNVK